MRVFIPRLKSILLVFILISLRSFSQTVVTVGGASANYPTLGAAFSAINTGALTGSITLQVIANTNETGTAFLQRSGIGAINYSSVLIYPTAVVQIGGNLNAELITLYETSNVTIDGRINQTGSVPALTISNSNYQSNSSTLCFYERASDNIVKYCIIKGSASANNKGVIVFSNTYASGLHGNNTVSDCDITYAGNLPTNAIYSRGALGNNNTGNKILNNRIYDFWNDTKTCGIFLNGYNSHWTISGNSFYQVYNRITGYDVYAIQIIKASNEPAQSGVGYTISDNRIGGSAPDCTGAPWTMSSGSCSLICVSAGSAQESTIENNKIRNFNTSLRLKGIVLLSGKAAIKRNIIGDSLGTASIVTPDDFSGIHTASGDSVRILDNRIGSITAKNLMIIRNQNTAAASVVTIAGNYIGSRLTSNSINCFTINGITSIHASTLKSNSIRCNTIKNIKANDICTGIYVNGKAKISCNMIGDSVGTGAITGNTVTVSGIIVSYVDSVVVDSNIIGSLKSNSHVVGIYNSEHGNVLFPATFSNLNSKSIISNNYIGSRTTLNSLWSAASYSVDSRVIGIMDDHRCQVTNNIVRGLTSSGNMYYNGGRWFYNVDGIDSQGTLIKNEVSHLYSTNTVNYQGLRGMRGQLLYNNFVHDIYPSGTPTGDILGMYIITEGSNNIVTLGSGSPFDASICGIQTGDFCNIYHNTVYIGGSCTSSSPSMALKHYNSYYSTNNQALNNIFVNARSNVSGGTGVHYVLYSNLNYAYVNYNHYYYPGVGGTFSNASLPILNNVTSNPQLINAGDNKPFSYKPTVVTTGSVIPSVTADYFQNLRANPPTKGAIERLAISVTAKTQSATACGSYVYKGQTYTASGTYNRYVAGPFGQDTSVTLSVTILPVYSDTANVSACYSHAFYGQTYTVSGVYSKHFTSMMGCDSIKNIRLNIYAPVTVSYVETNSLVCLPSNSLVLSAASPAGGTYSGTGVSSNVFDPVVAGPGTHTVTYAYNDTHGCLYTAAKTITVANTPTITVTASHSLICSGTPVALTATGTATSYSWTSGVTNGIPFTPTTTASYTVMGKNTEGCLTTSVNTVFVNSRPAVTASVTNAVVCMGTPVTLTGYGALTYTWTNGVLSNVPFTPSVSTTYTLTGTDANGCTNTAPITILVMPLPNVTANASSTQICRGSTVTLSGSGANSYVWSHGVVNGATFSPTLTTTYSLTGNNTSGCSKTVVITVSVNAIPSVTVATNNPTICVGESASLTASGASTYSWSTSQSGPAINVSPVTSTAYTVTGTANGCSSNASILQYVSLCTGIDAIVQSSAVSVYPNPSDGIFMINASHELFLVLLNELGQVVISVQLNHENNFRARFEGLANGVYILSGVDGSIPVHKKIVVSR